MASFDFDTVIDRRGSDSIKWGRYAGRDILPLWVADMDFAAPPAVQDALHRRIDHGVFGYAAPWPSLLEAVQDHLQRHYDWRIEATWLVWIPGIVAALNVACRAVGQAGAGVFASTPVYPPFLSAPGLSSRKLVTAPLRQTATRWEFDCAAADQVLDQAKLWLLCHPHNPVGRAWEEGELQEFARLAKQHDMVVCSDEIHCGLMLDEKRRHKPFAALSEDAAQRSITLMAPSKTYNLPGLYSAFAVIPNATLRRKFTRVMDGIMPHINTLGLVATEAAYRDCDDWHDALIGYLCGNAQLVKAAVAQLHGLNMTPVEATYLAWIDCRELCAMRKIENAQRFFEAAGVGFSNGADFGLASQSQGRPKIDLAPLGGGLGQRSEPGAQLFGDYAKFVRLNFGCPRSTLEEALRRMASAISR